MLTRHKPPDLFPFRVVSSERVTSSSASRQYPTWVVTHSFAPSFFPYWCPVHHSSKEYSRLYFVYFQRLPRTTLRKPRHTWAKPARKWTRTWACHLIMSTRKWAKDMLQTDAAGILLKPWTMSSSSWVTLTENRAWWSARRYQPLICCTADPDIDCRSCDIICFSVILLWVNLDPFI